MVAIKTSNISLLFSKFKLPKQDLSKLSFCGSDSNKVKQWLESLPITRITEIGVILYKALPQICRLKISPSKYIAILETIYPYVHQCIEGLMRELLRQPLLLSPQMMKIAMIAQALQRHLNDGYMIACGNLLQTEKTATFQQALALCLYRAISGLGLLLLRSHQFYTPQPPVIWRKLHTLYQLAIEQQLEKVPVDDTLLKNQRSMTINAAYKRSLLLACSSPYQLRQADIAHIFQAFEQCSSMVQLKAAAEDSRRSLYWVSLTLDKGPFYSSRLRGEPDKATYAICLEPLIDELAKVSDAKSDHQSKIHFAVPYKGVLVTHLLRNWKKANIRLGERQPSSEPLEICMGLTAIHDQLLGDHSFESLVSQSRQQHTGEASILEDFNNDWELEEQPVTGKRTAGENSETSLVKTINSSANGYCLLWDNAIPDRLRVGELLGIRKPKSSHWQIGIVCWAQRAKDKIYTGIQLLPEEATAYAASTVLRDGNKSAYFKVLVLANSTSIASQSIVTPSMPFEVDQTIRLRRYEEQISARLTSLLLASTTINQFAYQPLTPDNNG